MNEDLQKRTEDALQHLAENMKDEFNVCKNKGGIEFRGKTKLYHNTGESLYIRMWLSLESILEIADKMRYSVWVVRGEGRRNDNFKWIGYFAECNSFDKWATDEFGDFYEAMLEALLGAIYDRFPIQKEGE